jgi:hypothetical protein
MPELGPVAFLMAAALPSVEQPRITIETIDQIETMPEVRNLYPVVTPTFPIHAEATFLGEGFGSDVVVAGIDRALIASDLRGGEPFDPVDWRSGEVVPVLLSSYFVDLFNQLYAPTFNTPPLSESTAVGFDFTLTLGASVLGGTLGSDAATHVNCRVVGLTRNPQLLALTIPRRTAEEMQRRHGAAVSPEASISCTHAFAEIHSLDQIDALSGRLAAIDLTVESPSHMERVAVVERLLDLTSGALQMVILALTAFGCVCLMVLQMTHRRPSLVFLHVSGVPAPTIHGLMVGEAGCVVVTAAALGACGAMLLLNAALARMAALLPVSLPAPHLPLPAAVLVAALSVAVLAGTVTAVAVGVVAWQHRRVGQRPLG